MRKLRIELQRNMHREYRRIQQMHRVVFTLKTKWIFYQQEISASKSNNFMLIVIAFWVDSRSQQRIAIRIIQLIMETNIARANKWIIHRITIRIIHIITIMINHEWIITAPTKLITQRITAIPAIQSAIATSSINHRHHRNVNSMDCNAWNRHHYFEKCFRNLTRKSLNHKRWHAIRLSHRCLR